MKIIQIVIKSVFVSLLFLLLSCTNIKPVVNVSGELKQWHEVTLVIDGPETSELASENPFLNYRLQATFTKGHNSYTVPGFFAADGDAGNTSAEKGHKWKVIFRPSEVGEWTYSISFRKGIEIAIKSDEEGTAVSPCDREKGSFFVTESDKHGRDFKAHGRIINGGKGYFKYAGNNELFIKNGTNSPENFLGYYEFDQTHRFINKTLRDGEDNADSTLHHYNPHQNDWQIGDPTWADGKGKNIIGAINYLSAVGVNSMYFLTLNINGDGKDVWPYTSYEERYRFDCSKLDQWAVVFDHMENKGVMAHLILQETENECLLDGGDTGIQRKIYLRELTARFGHYLGLAWNLGEENGAADWSPIAQDDKQRKDMANYIKKINPFSPIVLLHTHSHIYEQDLHVNPILGFNNLDGISMQIDPPSAVNTRVDTFIRRSIKANKRWIVTMDELGPHWKGVMPDSFDLKHDTVRHQALWGTLLAGGAGVEWYFGWKYPEADLSMNNFRSRHNMWLQSTIATDFIKKYPLEDMYACNSMLSSKGEAYCLCHRENKFILGYLPYAYNANKVKLVEGDYQVKWFNPFTGGNMVKGNITDIKGGGMRNIGFPPKADNQDWLVVIEKN
ncbi:DUF5060 domain-containing protein [Ancylomarina sp. 16SWW S1-10-2]|uniref:DUF5060 domain-containing protein n=1 Tax=Ancylomarina sp. 16SWW S1-10-2 TaxID=2499681 RepID=UPI0012AE5BC4|nr:DUF5060 domain-containing protein [Ancylomarina sp. 16SWW S1-10-2]MRT92056.1 DUF5060 domain-containing protein [Ancylomarina sp. 16SWW S1-10-2]